MRQFWMKLAVIFGEPDVSALQEKVSSRQYMEWMAYDNIVALPDSWLQAARLAQCTNGVNAKDFIPTKKEVISDEMIWNAFKKRAKRG